MLVNDGHDAEPGEVDIVWRLVELREEPLTKDKRLPGRQHLAAWEEQRSYLSAPKLEGVDDLRIAQGRVPLAPPEL